MAVEIPHPDLPFRFSGGLLGTGNPVEVEQGSVDEIANCVQAIVRYEQGQREEAPEFGIPDPTFSDGDIDISEIKDQISIWEPRAWTALTERYDSVDDGIRSILLEVGVRDG